MDKLKDQQILALIQSYHANPWADNLKVLDSSRYQSFYAPMDHINPEARIVLVGITPGITQAKNAYEAAQSSLNEGASLKEALETAKLTASFSGTMRKNLIRMLDHVNLNKVLGISSCETLFSDNQHLCHFTSVLRYPTLKDKEMLKTAKPALSETGLKSLMETYFIGEVTQLSEAIYIPLGQGVADVLLHLVDRGLLMREQVFSGIPHPSGANAERIAYFLGQKEKELLSPKTNSTTIDARRLALQEQLKLLSNSMHGGQHAL
ncbi:hypothetical protein A3750_13645 [Oleiphilus sp. HI0079]|uniref:uracil-DNA glycosylase family protein n=2 Tax=Oleiphilus sp. HI0079 TaxID=1822254 RepID=UPI0007C376D3|nr:hypothetical protein [Oleiphilus sp. HI0079]KZZ14744.1 hypothetical protein A3750_13645 [Oleiphilus sp. HI0079]